ncbi:La, partial [Symbiodinium necroappetens]
MVYVGRQVLVGLLLPLLVSSSHHTRHARHSHHHVSHTQADHEDHHQSKLQNLQKAVIKDEVKETELQLQETRDREAIRITEEEVGRVGRDWGMLRSLQKHGQRKPSEEDLKVGEANLRELKSQMKQLQKGLNYAKEYVSDSEAQRKKLKAAIANSTLPEELKDAKHKYEQLQKHVTKATMKENAAWKDTVKREVELGEAKEQYSKNLKRLAAEEAELRSASAKLRQLKAGDESTTKQPAEGEPASERSGLPSRHAGWFAASVALSVPGSAMHDLPSPSQLSSGISQTPEAEKPAEKPEEKTEEKTEAKPEEQAKSEAAPAEKRKEGGAEPDAKRLKPTPPDPAVVRKQVEYYLSDENLKYDKFFHDKISANADGWLDMSFILSCNKMKSMRAGKDDVIAALKESKIELN